MSSVKWAEADFDPPPGAYRLGTQEPVDGKSYIMYHGTTRQSALAIRRSGFHRSKDGMLGPGVYLSRDLEKASRYPIACLEKDRVVIKVTVNVGKVKAINSQNHTMQKTWHDHGYDSAWVPPNCGMVKSGLEENCVWDPSRIDIIRLIYPTDRPRISLDEVLDPPEDASLTVRIINQQICNLAGQPQNGCLYGYISTQIYFNIFE